MDNLYIIIKEMCESRNIKIGKMCDDLGMTRSMMTDLKAGLKEDPTRKGKKSLSVKTLQRIADYFDVPVSYFLEEKKPTPKDELNFEEKELIRCWREATDDERETVAFTLRKHGMPFPERKMEQSRSGRVG